MIEASRDAMVLKPSVHGASGEALRRRLNRRHLLISIGIALLFHILIVLGFWLVDRIRVQDIGDWSGPVLVKIGVQDAPDSPAVDPGPLPDQPEESEQPDIPEESLPETAPEAAPDSSTPLQPETSPDSTRPEENQPEAESSIPESRPAPPPQPSRVNGEEDGNSYEMNFDGSEGDVGRAGAYEYISSYMPLPLVLEASLVEGIVGTTMMSPDLIRGELESYYMEEVGGDYSKKQGPAGIIPMQDRPYYWSLIVNYLGYKLEDADWRTYGMRPVVVEFTVSPSKGPRGADLSDITLKTRTNNPQVDDAVIYGLSRWVYYNDTDHPIKGRITYRFDR
ncbi:MAG: hypothetical protein DRP70_02155 [Spirochaetes bacterium]|nr:MAG: hypothetical protein DRP70_02155 [Spirochaetota bacterium]